MSKKIRLLGSGKRAARIKEKIKAINELRKQYPIKDILPIFKVSKSAYYYQLSSKCEKDDNIIQRIKDIFNSSNNTYGYRRITLLLKVEYKINVNHKKVKRIMKENGLFAHQGTCSRYYSYRGDNGVEKRNLLLEKVWNEEWQKEVKKRNFETSKPNEKWVTDVSMFKINNQKLYLSPIMDLYDRSIISFDLSTTPNFEQIKRMLESAFKDKDLAGLILHSDQGWQYQMKEYREALSERGIFQSFSRKGNCMDNGLMENFFGIMKNEMFYGYEETFNSIDSLKLAIENYIYWYNNSRINLSRDGLSPLIYRKKYYEELKIN